MTANRTMRRSLAVIVMTITLVAGSGTATATEERWECDGSNITLKTIHVSKSKVAAAFDSLEKSGTLARLAELAQTEWFGAADRMGIEAALKPLADALAAETELTKIKIAAAIKQMAQPGSQLGTVTVHGHTENAFSIISGLNRSWVWGPRATGYIGLYQINLGTDGWARYYDFTGTEPGERIKPNHVFTCRKLS